MENSCIYVSSRGILKSCDIKSVNPQSSCDTDKKYLLDMLVDNKMFDGMTIYVCSDLLTYFVKEILPKINTKFILVSGDSDLCIPTEALISSLFFNLINNSFLIKWFAQNINIQHYTKIIQLPIGLDYHTILNNPNYKWVSNGESNKPIDQEQILLNIQNSKSFIPFYERIPKIYVNFSTHTDRFNERKKALINMNMNTNKLLQKNMDFIPRTQNWKNMIKYSFILCPFGNGWDTHRAWEALCLGCIPIMKGRFFTKLFENLPVLFVDKWTDITEKLLSETIIQFKQKHLSDQFNYEKLTLKFWTDQFIINNNNTIDE